MLWAAPSKTSTMMSFETIALAPKLVSPQDKTTSELAMHTAKLAKITNTANFILIVLSFRIAWMLSTVEYFLSCYLKCCGIYLIWSQYKFWANRFSTAKNCKHLINKFRTNTSIELKQFRFICKAYTKTFALKNSREFEDLRTMFLILHDLKT